MNKFILPLFFIFLGIAGAAGWYFINKPTEVPFAKKDYPMQIAATATPVTENIPTVVQAIPTEKPLQYVNPSVTIDAFETAIPLKQYSDLAPFMTDTVTVIKYATSCCGPLPKATAISEMAYLSGGTDPWNFADSNPIAAKLATADPDNFKEAYVGTAGNRYAVGLTLDDNFLINKVIITNDYQLIIGL